MDKLAIGSDHGGLELKNKLARLLEAKSMQVEDVGPYEYDKEDDYPDYAGKVCNKIDNGKKGILICKSGHGMAIAANKFKGIRASVCWNEDSAEKAKKDDDINVICLPAEMISANEAAGIVLKWLETPFESIERRTRRLKKIEKIEDKNFKKG